MTKFQKPLKCKKKTKHLETFRVSNRRWRAVWAHRGFILHFFVQFYVRIMSFGISGLGQSLKERLETLDFLFCITIAPQISVAQYVFFFFVVFSAPFFSHSVVIRWIISNGISPSLFWGNSSLLCPFRCQQRRWIINQYYREHGNKSMWHD